MRFRRLRHVAATEQAGEVLLLDIDRGTYYSLNGVGGYIWECLAESLSIDDLRARLETRYAIAPDRANADATTFVRALLDAALIAPV